MQTNSRTIIATGRPGVGKSYFGNFLLSNNPHSQIFKSESNPGEFGITKNIQITKKYAKHLKCSIEFVDVPGSGDPTISIKSLADDLVNQLSNKTINTAMMLVSAQDDRATGAEALTISFLKNFFNSKGMDTKDCLWLIITRCQEKKPDQKFIKGKLEFLKKCGLEIKMDRSLFEIDENKGLQVETNVEQALKNFSKDLREVSMKDPCVKQDFEQFEMMMRMAMETNEKLARQLDQQANLLRDLANRDSGGRFCNIF